MPDIYISELMVQIHQIQRQLSDLNSRLQRGPKMINAQEGAIRQISSRLEQTRAEHQKLLKFAKEKEQSFAQNEAALGRRKNQLHEAKNNKEFQALKLQIHADEAANAVMADETFEAMEKAEKFAPEIDKIVQELQAVKETLQKTTQHYAQEVPVIHADIERCHERLHEVEKGLPQEFREFYSRLTKVMGGEDALAPVSEQKFCGGCHQQIPINFIAQVIQGKPVTCKSCGRLLYVPEGFSAK